MGVGTPRGQHGGDGGFCDWGSGGERDEERRRAEEGAAGWGRDPAPRAVDGAAVGAGVGAEARGAGRGFALAAGRWSSECSAEVAARGVRGRDDGADPLGATAAAEATVGEVECDHSAPAADADADDATDDEGGKYAERLAVKGASTTATEEPEAAERAGRSIGDGAAELAREEGMEGGTEGGDADDAGVTAVTEAGETGAGLLPLRLDTAERGVPPADPSRELARSR